MKALIGIAAFLLCGGLFLATNATDETPAHKGEWRLNNWTPRDSVRLTLTHTSRSSGLLGRISTSSWTWGSDQPLADLHGLTRDQLHAARAQVAFTLARDAGVLTFTGSVMLGLGHGEYRFEPNPSFVAALAALGYDTTPDSDLFSLAIHDISLAYAKEAKAAGVRDVQVEDLVRFRDHGIDLDFIRGLAAIGYSHLTTEDVVQLRDHGVDGDYLRGLMAAGCAETSADDIVMLHDHGIDPQYVARIRASGFKDLGVEQFVTLHDHGIDPRYVARMQASGYKDLTVEQLVRLHDHGVD